MKLSPQSTCQLALLSLCCMLAIVQESACTFVPGRCLCPAKQDRVRGQLKELNVYPKNPSCDEVTVIVTLKSNNRLVCLNPEAPLGKQLIRCWKRAQNLGRDVKVCLKRRKKGRGRQRHRSRSRGQSRRVMSSSSQ